jgi:hypothetical protein
MEERAESYEEPASAANLGGKKVRIVGGPSCLLLIYKKRRKKETKLGD